MPMQGTFDASAIQPQQGGGRHPPGNKFPFRITNTEIKGTKDNSNGYLAVELTSDLGSIVNNYNLFHSNAQTVEIAQKQLSALCHATGVMKLDFNNDAAALRGARGLMDIGFQKGQEPSAEKPEGGYVEVKKVYDVNGNEPGKTPAQQASSGFGQPNTNQQQQPTQQQPQPTQGGWPGQGTQAPMQQQPQPQQNQPQGGWQQPQQNAQPQNPAGNGGGWQQNAGGAPNNNPPWSGTPR